MINEHELMVWCAGVVEGCGIITATTEEGPTGKQYAALTLHVPISHESQINRFMIAANNGTHEHGLWELSGSAAVKGFLQSIWTWLTPEGKSYFNEQIRKFKELQQKLAS